MLPRIFYARPPRGVRSLALLALLSDHLSVLLQGGVPLPAALVLCAETVHFASYRDALLQGASRLAEGSLLSTTLSEHPDLFPLSFQLLIRVAESSPVLPAVLTSASRTLATVAHKTRTLLGLLVMPAVALCGVAAVAIFFSYSLKPALLALGNECAAGGATHPEESVLPLVFSMLIMGGAALAHEKVRKYIKMKIPLYHLFQRFLFFSLWSMLRSAHVPFLETLEACQLMLYDAAAKRGVGEVIAALKRGEVLLSACERHIPMLCTTQCAAILASGMESGDFTAASAQVARLTEYELGRALERATRVVPLIVLACVAGIVALLISSIYGVLFASLSQGMSQLGG